MTIPSELLERILLAEVEFYNEHVREPSFLILTTDAYMQIIIELDLDISENICTYEGLPIAVLPTPNCVLDNRDSFMFV